MQLMVMFSNQLTTSLLHKLAIHRAVFWPTLHHQNTDATAHDVTATCNHPYLGTQPIPFNITNSSTVTLWMVPPQNRSPRTVRGRIHGPPPGPNIAAIPSPPLPRDGPTLVMAF